MARIYGDNLAFLTPLFCSPRFCRSPFCPR